MTWTGQAEKQWAQARVLLDRGRHKEATPLALAAVRAAGWSSMDSPLTLMWLDFYPDDRIPLNWVLTDHDAGALLLHPEMMATWNSSQAPKRTRLLDGRPSGFHKVSLEVLQTEALDDLLYQMDTYGC